MVRYCFPVACIASDAIHLRLVYNAKAHVVDLVKIMKIQELSNSEKVTLAQELWDSVIVNQQALDITQEQKDELDQRLAQFEVDTESGASWQDVKARILNN